MPTILLFSSCFIEQKRYLLSDFFAIFKFYRQRHQCYSTDLILCATREHVNSNYWKIGNSLRPTTNIVSAVYQTANLLKVIGRKFIYYCYLKGIIMTTRLIFFSILVLFALLLFAVQPTSETAIVKCRRYGKFYGSASCDNITPLQWSMPS